MESILLVYLDRCLEFLTILTAPLGRTDQGLFQSKITPDVMVNGGGLFNAWLATAFRPIPEHLNGVSVPGDPGAAPLVEEGSEDDQGEDG